MLPLNGAGEKAARGEEVRLLVPNQLCGALIGRSGETIRNFINDSQASIKVSNVEEMPFGAADRIVKVRGGRATFWRIRNSLLKEFDMEVFVVEMGVVLRLFVVCVNSPSIDIDIDIHRSWAYRRCLFA